MIPKGIEPLRNPFTNQHFRTMNWKLTPRIDLHEFMNNLLTIQCHFQVWPYSSAFNTYLFRSSHGSSPNKFFFDLHNWSHPMMEMNIPRTLFFFYRHNDHLHFSQCFDSFGQRWWFLLIIWPFLGHHISQCKEDSINAIFFQVFHKIEPQFDFQQALKPLHRNHIFLSLLTTGKLLIY